MTTVPRLSPEDYRANLRHATTLATHDVTSSREPHVKTYPRRNLRGHFAIAVRPDGWRDSDLAGQASAAELAAIGATSIHVNTFGVAFGVIDGVRVLLSPTSPARYQRPIDDPDVEGFEWVTADDDWTHVVVTRAHWTMRTGGFLRVTRMATAVEALAA